MIVGEVIDLCLKSKVEVVVFKLDFCKVYDLVFWGFFDIIL